jgi:hypothetical protein
MFRIFTQYAEGVVLDMEAMWSESEPRTPLICFLSMGSDPTENIERLARNKSIRKAVVLSPRLLILLAHPSQFFVSEPINSV